MTSLPDPVLHRRRSVRIGIRLRHCAPRSLINAGLLRRCRRGARLATTHGSATWPDALRPVQRHNEGARELPIGWRSSTIAVALRQIRQSGAALPGCRSSSKAAVASRRVAGQSPLEEAAAQPQTARLGLRRRTRRHPVSIPRYRRTSGASEETAQLRWSLGTGTRSRNRPTRRRRCHSSRLGLTQTTTTSSPIRIRASRPLPAASLRLPRRSGRGRRSLFGRSSKASRASISRALGVELRKKRPSA